MADGQSIEVEIVPSTPIIWPKVIVPEAYKGKDGKGKGDLKYELSYLFDADHPALEAAKTAAGKLADEAFPGVDFASLTFPFKNGDKLADEAKAKARAKGQDSDPYAHLRGKVILTARSGAEYPPHLAAVINGSATDLEGDTRAQAGKYFYSGVRVLGSVRLKAFEISATNRGVAARIGGTVSLNKGDRIGGGGSTADRYSGHIGQESDHDPLAGTEPVQGSPARRAMF